MYMHGCSFCLFAICKLCAAFEIAIVPSTSVYSARPLPPFCSMAAKQTITDEFKAKVNDIIDVANRTGQKVSAWETMRQLFLDNGFAWHGKCPPDYVANHPQNRRPHAYTSCETSCESCLCMHFRLLSFAGAAWEWQAFLSTTMVRAF